MRTFKFRVWDGRGFLNSDEFCLFPEDDGTFSAMYLESFNQLKKV